jgi:hypothetical protein
MTYSSWIVTTNVCLSHSNTLKASQKRFGEELDKSGKYGLLAKASVAHRPIRVKDSNSPEFRPTHWGLTKPLGGASGRLHIEHVKWTFFSLVTGPSGGTLDRPTRYQRSTTQSEW